MTKDTFIGYIKNASQYTLQDKLDIHNEKVNYPFCSVLQVLDILSDKSTAGDNWNSDSASKVAVQVTNIALLNKMLANVISAQEDNSQEAKHLKEKIEMAKNKEKGFTASGEFDILSEINSLQDDVSFKTAPKSVILEEYLNSDTTNPQQKTQKTELSIDELGKKSNSENNVLETETLAVIFEKQGKIEKSIEIYKKLMLKNPEKSSIFANRISELETKLNQN